MKKKIPMRERDQHLKYQMQSYKHSWLVNLK